MKTYDYELAGILKLHNGLKSCEAHDIAHALPDKVCNALNEIDAGSSVGQWQGNRKRTLGRVLAIGSYSDTPSLVAKGSDNLLYLTPLGRAVLTYYDARDI